jgi:hypothetical protein
LPVVDSATPDRVHAALTTDVAQQWISTSNRDRVPRLLVQFDSLDLRSGFALVHLQVIGRSEPDEEARSDVRAALRRMWLAFPLRRIYAEIADPWVRLYETLLPDARQEARLRDHFHLGGCYVDKVVLTMPRDPAC